MCGRFVQYTGSKELAEYFNAEAPTVTVDIHYNGAPSQVFAAIAGNAPRKLGRLQWGLIPAWARDKSIAARLINARRETVRQKPAFRNAFRERRCIIPANGFYEWLHTPGGKIPQYIFTRDASPLALAGLWESWRNPAEPGAARLHTFTIITTNANTYMAPIHNRMPLILLPNELDTWLDANARESDLAHLLDCTVPEDLLDHYAVSQRVNNPQFNDPALIQRAA